MSDRSLRVALVVRFDVVRAGLRTMLGELAGGLPLAVRHDLDAPADLVVVDEWLGRRPGPGTHAATPTLVVTYDDGGRDVLADPDATTRRIGVAVTRDELRDRLAEVLHPTRPDVVERLRAGAATGAALSPRERDVLPLIAAGRSNSQIAAELFLGINTVKTHLRAAYRKIGVCDRTQAVAWAFEHGFRSTSDIGP